MLMLAIYFALFSYTTAFVPVKVGAVKLIQNTNLQMAFEMEVGALKPVGYFDPLGEQG